MSAMGNHLIELAEEIGEDMDTEESFERVYAEFEKRCAEHRSMLENTKWSVFADVPGQGTVRYCVPTTKDEALRIAEQLRPVRQNVRLISDATAIAAAELLHACKNVVWKLSHNWDDGLPARIDRRDATARLCRSAIAKAEWSAGS